VRSGLYGETEKGGQGKSSGRSRLFSPSSVSLSACFLLSN
jgi:hypothetical protein